MTLPCDCCEGIQSLTPLSIYNRPGLSQLSYRVGDYATFYESMLAGLTGQDSPLLALKTRDPSDFSIALLDAWAMVADVLTFYQERIANEGYLRTATERRSILELARLVGYRLRPGVSASVYLAYNLETPVKSAAQAAGQTTPVEIVIPAGSKAQSLPTPPDLPQTFETAEDLTARPEWNAIQPRLTRPLDFTYDQATMVATLYFTGISANLKKGDPLLLVFADPASTNPSAEKYAVRRVSQATQQSAQNRTQVDLEPVPGLILQLATLLDQFIAKVNAYMATSGADVQTAQYILDSVTPIRQGIVLGASAGDLTSQMNNLFSDGITSTGTTLDPIVNQLSDDWTALLKGPGATPTPVVQLTDLQQLVAPLVIPPTLQPANSVSLARSLPAVFRPESDVNPQMLVSFIPQLEEVLYPALANASVSQANPHLKAVYALRQTASLFGYNAPKVITLTQSTSSGVVTITQSQADPSIDSYEAGNYLYLDSSNDAIQPTSYTVIKESDGTVVVHSVTSIDTLTRSSYGINSKTTRLVLDQDWWNPYNTTGGANLPTGFNTLRSTTALVQSENLPLAEVPITHDIGLDPKNPDSAKTIELDGLYDGLKSGRWVIVNGERTDIPGVTGVIKSELVMIAGVAQTATLPGDKVHTTLTLAKAGLAYSYKRDTVSVYANVVQATHGETKKEILGAGDATKVYQSFTLHQPPVTYLSAPTPSGITSTLRVFVNNLEWHESDTFVGQKPNSRVFITKSDDNENTSVITGNGVAGARLPTGQDNVTSIYRSGIGKIGNVKANTITLLVSKPLGVKDVNNPIEASGGADRDNLTQARHNTPLALLALDRLVSVQDYADFTSAYAGIGKASAARLTDGLRTLVHVTIAGAEDIPIDTTSDLFRNLRKSLSQSGDPHVAVQVDVRELLALVISANVKLLPDYQWESIAPQINAAVLDEFSFDNRQLGQSVFLSEVVSVIQNVTGVAYVDVDIMDTLTASEVVDKKLLTEKIRQWQSQPKPPDVIPVRMDETVAQARNYRPLSTAQNNIYPAQLCYLLPDVKDAFVLKQITD